MHTQPSRLPLSRVDLGVAALVAVASWMVASRALSHMLAVPWIEDFLVPCAGRPGWTPDPTIVQSRPEWQALLAGRLGVFPCASISDLPLIEVGASWRQVEYFHRALAVLYRATGPTATAFASFQTILFVFVNVSLYGLFRLIAAPLIAVAGTAGLMVSRWQLEALQFPIEYAKAPWILATVFLCGLLIKRSLQNRPTSAVAAATGLVAGLGMGFKPDVMAVIPLAVIVAAVAAQGIRSKATALACLLAGFMIGAGPLVVRTWGAQSGSLLAVQFLGGQDSAAEAMLASTPFYDYGLAFDDSHITVLLNSYGRHVMGATTPFYFFSREMQEASSRLLLEMWSTFPGDLVLRVIGSVLRLLAFAAPGITMAALGVAAVFAMHRRAGWWSVFIATYLAAYVSLVFQRRHFFHLEVIGWWFSAALIQAAWLLARERWHGRAVDGMGRRLISAAASVALVAAGGWGTLAVARSYQQRAVTRAIADRLAAPADDRVFTIEPAGTSALVRIADVSADATASPAADAMRGDYIKVRLQCPSSQPIAMSLVYGDAGRSWNRETRVPCDGGVSTVMTAVYQYGQAFRFLGLSLPLEAAGSVRQVSVVRPVAAIGAWPQFALPAGWADAPLHKLMRLPVVVP